MNWEFLKELGLPEAAEEAVRQAWEEAMTREQTRHEQAIAEQEKAMGALRLEFALREAINAQGGRNEKAIAALVDTGAVAAAEDPRQAAAEAVAAVKRECGYLFAGPAAPVFAPGAGAVGSMPMPSRETLADALRERFAGRE